MEILSFQAEDTGLLFRTKREVRGLRAKERRTELKFEIPFSLVADQNFVDFAALQNALPPRMGRYDLVALTDDDVEHTIDLPDHSGLPAWRRFHRPKGVARPLLPHIYVDQNGSLAVVVRNPTYVDEEERDFRCRHELTAIRLGHGQLLCSFELELSERGEFQIDRCYLRLRSNESLVEIDAARSEYAADGSQHLGHVTFDLPVDAVLTPVRYSLHIRLRIKSTGESIELTLNHLSQSLYDEMTTCARPPTTRLAGDQVLALAFSPSSSLVSFVVRPRTRYDRERVRQSIFSNVARLESRLRSVLRRPRKPTAMIFEKDAATAQDNGFALFLHLRETTSSADFDYYFILDRSSEQWDRVRHLQQVVPKFSFKYWRLLVSPAAFLASSDVRYHLSNLYAQPGIADKYAFLRKNYFLQHGVTGMKRVPIFRPQSPTFPEAVVATAEWEKEVLVGAGIPADRIDVVGFARWDRLSRSRIETSRKLLFMPTWREWLEGRDADGLKDSTYARAISSFLRSNELERVLEENDVELHFLAHPKFPDLAKLFDHAGPRIKVLTQDEVSFADLIDSSFAVVTDYSSIAWDFIQAGKSAVLFQFDFDHYQRVTGMYSGSEFEKILALIPTAQTEQGVLNIVSDLLATDSEELRLRADDFARRVFPFHDQQNGQRTVDSINRRLDTLSSPRTMPGYGRADNRYRRQLARAFDRDPVDGEPSSK